LPRLRASSIDSGSFSPVVSGNKNARHPAVVANEPIMIIGKGFQILLSEPMSKEIIPEIKKFKCIALSWIYCKSFLYHYDLGDISAH